MIIPSAFQWFDHFPVQQIDSEKSLSDTPMHAIGIPVTLHGLTFWPYIPTKPITSSKSYF